MPQSHDDIEFHAKWVSCKPFKRANTLWSCACAGQVMRMLIVSVNIFVFDLPVLVSYLKSRLNEQHTWAMRSTAYISVVDITYGSCHYWATVTWTSPRKVKIASLIFPSLSFKYDPSIFYQFSTWRWNSHRVYSRCCILTTGHSMNHIWWLPHIIWIEITACSCLLYRSLMNDSPYRRWWLVHSCFKQRIGSSDGAVVGPLSTLLLKVLRFSPLL